MLNDTYLEDADEMQQLEQQVNRAILELDVWDKTMASLQVQNLIHNMRQDLLNLPYLM